MLDHMANRRKFLSAGLIGAASIAGVAAATDKVMAQQGGNVVPNLYPRLNARNFRALRDHENIHVETLVSVLGAQARPKPVFQGLQMPNMRAFVTTTQALELTGVGAYLGALPVIFSRQFQASAGSIALIEAQHSGYVNTIVNDVSTTDVAGTEQSFANPLTVAEVNALAGPFVANLNGGPPLAFNATPSRNNDIAILNFALLLEYLEAEFFNINVPRFFPG